MTSWTSEPNQHSIDRRFAASCPMRSRIDRAMPVDRGIASRSNPTPGRERNRDVVGSTSARSRCSRPRTTSRVMAASRRPRPGQTRSSGTQSPTVTSSTARRSRSRRRVRSRDESDEGRRRVGHRLGAEDHCRSSALGSRETYDVGSLAAPLDERQRLKYGVVQMRDMRARSSMRTRARRSLVSSRTFWSHQGANSTRSR